MSWYSLVRRTEDVPSFSPSHCVSPAVSGPGSASRDVHYRGRWSDPGPLSTSEDIRSARENISPRGLFVGVAPRFHLLTVGAQVVSRGPVRPVSRPIPLDNKRSLRPSEGLRETYRVGSPSGRPTDARDALQSPSLCTCKVQEETCKEVLSLVSQTGQ